MALSFPGLKGKTFAVTGANSGMGRAISILLAEEGANVGLIDLNSPDKVQAEIAKAFPGARAISLKVNTMHADEVNAAMKRIVDEFGQLDGAANMAGTAGRRGYGDNGHYFEVLDDEEWDEIVRTNLDGVKNCQRAEVQLMKGPGSIVNASSISGQFATQGMGPYCAAKYGVIAITQCLAREVGSRGIRVNAVAPGFTKTGLTAGLGEEELVKVFTPRIALRRFAAADEVAKVVLFLLSDASSYVSASVVNVDGGFL